MDLLNDAEPARHPAPHQDCRRTVTARPGTPA